MPTFWSNLSYQVGSFRSRKRLPCVSVGMTLVQLNSCLRHSGWWKNSSDQKWILHADPGTRLCCICHSRFSYAFNSKLSAIAEAFVDWGDVTEGMFESYGSICKMGESTACCSARALYKCPPSFVAFKKTKQRHLLCKDVSGLKKKNIKKERLQGDVQHIHKAQSFL